MRSFLRSLAREEAVLTWLAFPRNSPAAKMAEERALHESKLQKMEAEMKMGTPRFPFLGPLCLDTH